MRDKALLDTGIISALFFKEEISERVEKIVETYEDLITVDLAIPELTNVAWKRVQFFKESKETIEVNLRKGIEFIVRACDVISSCEICEKAFEIAIRMKITVYDALFLAAAEKEGADFITSDSKLVEKLKG
ncbi:MAG: PIN domain-containing protein, partial [Thermoproteota archaeon]